MKLGTITPEGGDVFSYDEDDMVLDTNLSNHLAHFGINVALMHKTEKTMGELQVCYTFICFLVLNYHTKYMYPYI